MTFNQWCAACHVNDNSMRLAFEGVWNAMIGSETSESEASSLLTDLMQALPEPDECDCGDEDF